MGGQQFGDASILIDTRALNRVIDFDAERGSITVEGGIQWPAVIDYLNRAQEGSASQWGIYQKQTGADRLSIGGALACNAHGRGLNLKPIIQQVEQFDLVGPDGDVRTCSRVERPELFRLVIGGYGLFGIVTRVQLRLRPLVKVRRVVEIGQTANIIERFEQRIREGYLYGDYQFTTDADRDSFLRRGVWSCYEPVADDTPLTQNATRFNPEDWARLTFYSHRYKRRAFEAYSSRYLTCPPGHPNAAAAWGPHQQREDRAEALCHHAAAGVVVQTSACQPAYTTSGRVNPWGSQPTLRCSRMPTPWPDFWKMLRIFPAAMRWASHSRSRKRTWRRWCAVMLACWRWAPSRR